LKFEENFSHHYGSMHSEGTNLPIKSFGFVDCAILGVQLLLKRIEKEVI